MCLRERAVDGAVSSGERVSLDLETHHRDDVGYTVSAVDDRACQCPLSHLSGRPGGCQSKHSLAHTYVQRNVTLIIS